MVPCSEPRYLRIRSRRVEVCSVTRWSRTITQSETYSSMPWRVSVPSPRSPVITAVTPRSLSQPNRRRSSARSDGRVGERAEQRLDRVDHDALRADRVDRRAEPQEQPVEVPVAGLLDLVAVDVDVVDHEQAVGLEAGRGRTPATRRWRSRSSRDSSNATNTPGSSNSVIPRTRNSIASSVLPQPGRAADERRTSARQPAAGHLVEAADARRAFGSCVTRASDPSRALGSSAASIPGTGMLRHHLSSGRRRAGYGGDDICRRVRPNLASLKTDSTTGIGVDQPT